MSTAAELDVRTIEPRERHMRIFAQLDALGAGQALKIVNDHDPVPLRRQIESLAPGLFQWEYLQAGPDLWRIQISKQAGEAQRSSGSCCSGGCCG